MVTNNTLRKAKKYAKGMLDAYNVYATYYGEIEPQSVRVKQAYLECKQVYLLLEKYHCNINSISEEFKGNQESGKFFELVQRYAFLYDNLLFLSSSE